MLSRTDLDPSSEYITQSVRKACALIPPAWPLKATVAVNPFLGHASQRFSEVSHTIRQFTGQGLVMPNDWYLARIQDGDISHSDLSYALSKTNGNAAGLSVDKLVEMLEGTIEQPRRLRTVLDLGTAHSEIDLPELAIDCIGNWAASFFDEGQALWTLRKKNSAWQDWRIYSRHDLVPEINGLNRFAERSDETPNEAIEFIRLAVLRLGIPREALKTYFHHLLFGLLGWSQLARYRQWQAELEGGSDDILFDLLAIRLFWEVAVFEDNKNIIETTWKHEIAQYVEVDSGHLSFLGQIDEILQVALDRSVQRQLVDEFSKAQSAPKPSEPFAQIAFCIDVRSEPVRRAIEANSEDIETIGFAGFFGLPIDHDPFASDMRESRLPVLLSPSLKTKTTDNDTQADRDSRYYTRAVRAWGRFKLAAVSSFAFVEAAGGLYLGKLIDQQFLKRQKRSTSNPKPDFAEELSKEDKASLAKTILTAMSLTSGFRDLVVLCGHGASVVNNPHESALQCGACGGYAGDVSARLLAGLLNDPETRSGLIEVGIEIPKTTWFIGGLHDTTTDEITLYDEDLGTEISSDKVARLKDVLQRSSLANRQGRLLRLPGARTPADVISRGLDWAQTRPEWGLAGCKSFIAAPRARTAGRDLKGEAFLHSYDWKQDPDFNVLELIMTAPVVVASWISLQYFASTVAPDIYGGGNKLLHNIVGGIGVLEGNGGPMRTGLPIQSVHDGEAFSHLPARLSVIIEAPIEAINGVLERHEAIRDLFDNDWLHLFQMDDVGHLSSKYAGGLKWNSLAVATRNVAEAELVA